MVKMYPRQGFPLLICFDYHNINNQKSQGVSQETFGFILGNGEKDLARTCVRYMSYGETIPLV
jgi:hypothetical protein